LDSPAENDNSEWQMMVTVTIAEVSRILWRNNIANYLHVYALESSVSEGRP
jgi:hypothetical protein